MSGGQRGSPGSLVFGASRGERGIEKKSCAINGVRSSKKRKANNRRRRQKRKRKNNRKKRIAQGQSSASVKCATIMRAGRTRIQLMRAAQLGRVGGKKSRWGSPTFRKRWKNQKEVSERQQSSIGGQKKETDDWSDRLAKKVQKPAGNWDGKIRRKRETTKTGTSSRSRVSCRGSKTKKGSWLSGTREVKDARGW